MKEKARVIKITYLDKELKLSYVPTEDTSTSIPRSYWYYPKCGERGYPIKIDQTGYSINDLVEFWILDSEVFNKLIINPDKNGLWTP